MAINGLGRVVLTAFAVCARRDPGAAHATHPLIGTRTRISRMADGATGYALCLWAHVLDWLTVAYSPECVEEEFSELRM